MITGELVREVSRTAQPATVGAWALRINYLIENTRGSDWDGCYLTLTPIAAARIARDLNADAPWGVPAPRPPRRRRAVATRRHPTIEGKVVDVVEVTER